MLHALGERLAHRLGVYVGAEFLFEMLGQPGSRPPRNVVAFFRRRRFQNALKLFLGLLAPGLWRAAFSFAVVEARGAFLIEAADPLVDHRVRDLMQVGNRRSGVAPAAQKDDVGTRRHTSDCFSLPCV